MAHLLRLLAATASLVLVVVTAADPQPTQTNQLPGAYDQLEDHVLCKTSDQTTHEASREKAPIITKLVGPGQKEEDDKENQKKDENANEQEKQKPEKEEEQKTDEKKAGDEQKTNEKKDEQKETAAEKRDDGKEDEKNEDRKGNGPEPRNFQAH